MKQSVFIYLFFILIAPNVFAGVQTTTLTTYYPAPTAAYRQVSLSNSYINNATSSTVTNFCTSSSSIGLTYLDTNHNNVLYQCTGYSPPTSVPANGTVHSDSNGSLHVIMGGQDLTYPQECLNHFCSYTIASGTCASNAASSSCSAYIATPGTSQGSCPSTGGLNQMPVDSTKTLWYDLLQTSPTTCVISIVCCTSIYNSSLTTPSTGYPPDENTPEP